MSKIFGVPAQNGYVVEDIDQAIDHWVKVLGVGPFFKRAHAKLSDYQFNGVACAPDLSIAIGYCGNFQIELIQQHNDAPSHYKDFIDRYGYGLHHILCVTPGLSLKDNLARLAELGYVPASSGKISGGGNFAYFATDTIPGTVIEIGDGSPEVREIFAAIHQASVDWDGSDPVRELPLGG